MTQPDAMISDPCNLAMKHRLYYALQIHPTTTSNKKPLEPHEWKPEPSRTSWGGWHNGYSFKHFWSCCFFLLGDIGMLDGIQQLCHHYYLGNGSLGAVLTVARIKKFLGLEE